MIFERREEDGKKNQHEGGDGKIRAKFKHTKELEGRDHENQEIDRTKGEG